MGRWILAAVAVFLGLCASFAFYQLSTYNRALEQFNLGIRSYDRSESKKGLDAVKASYLSFSSLGLQYVADKYLFKDMYKYEAAENIVEEDYEKAIGLLSGHDDDREALNMKGVAKFRILHAAYHSEAADKDKKIKDDILRRVLEEVRPDFEASVKKGHGPAEDFNPIYNYDLTSDPNSAKAALESVRPTLRFTLGINVQGKDPGKTGRVKPGQKRMDEPVAPGSGNAKKRG